MRLRVQIGEGGGDGVVRRQAHTGLDTPSPSTARSFLDTMADHLAFDKDSPPNERIDLQQAQSQMVRTTRRAVDLSEGQ